jgi:hypothetical protein
MFRNSALPLILRHAVVSEGGLRSLLLYLDGPLPPERAVGEHGCVPLLVRLLEAKSSRAREVAAQALASLLGCPANARKVRKDDKGVARLLQLLDPSPANTAKKYAIACLLTLSAAKRCRKMMISHCAIGYLKKLSDMDVAGARKLLERLERGSLRSLFSRIRSRDDGRSGGGKGDGGWEARGARLGGEGRRDVRDLGFGGLHLFI